MIASRPRHRSVRQHPQLPRVHDAEREKSVPGADPVGHRSETDNDHHRQTAEPTTNPPTSSAAADDHLRCLACDSERVRSCWVIAMRLAKVSVVVFNFDMKSIFDRSS
ncbi:hypothetical protein JTB14_019421 [Gonioctena quinquepunctata]|nr:hypothetical protein JTB14_019421 [Gonioctena quinquepunctata]